MLQKQEKGRCVSQKSVEERGQIRDELQLRHRVQHRDPADEVVSSLG